MFLIGLHVAAAAAADGALEVINIHVRHSPPPKYSSHVVCIFSSLLGLKNKTCRPSLWCWKARDSQSWRTDPVSHIRFFWLVCLRWLPAPNKQINIVFFMFGTRCLIIFLPLFLYFFIFTYFVIILFQLTFLLLMTKIISVSVVIS